MQSIYGPQIMRVARLPFDARATISNSYSAPLGLGAGWGNAMQELLMNAELAYRAKRACVCLLLSLLPVR
jgi:hypothetical protein